MEAQADLIDALEKESENNTASQSLRAKAAIIKSEARLKSLLISIEDQIRQLKAFDRVRAKLEPLVRSKYSNIEEAERDNWEAVLKYRMARNNMGHKDFINHVPFPKEAKAEIGIKYGCPDALLWLAVTDEDVITKNHNGNVVEYIESKKGKISRLEVKWRKTTGQHSDPTPR
jgi:hypothetical protein